MKIHRLLQTSLICCALVIPAIGQPPPHEPPHPGMEGPRDGRGREEAPNDKPSWDRRGSWGGRDDRDGPPRDAFEKMKYSSRVILRYKWEADHLADGVEEIDKMKAKTKERLKAGEITAERADRIMRIQELKRELLPLQKEEFVDRMRESIDEGMVTLREARATLKQDDPRLRIVDMMIEKAETLKAQATDFDSLHAALEEVGPFRGPRGDDGESDDVRRREVDDLRRRLDRLEMEVMEPDDRSLMYGVDDPPPMANRNRHGRPNDP